MPYPGMSPFYAHAGLGPEGDAKSNKPQNDASEVSLKIIQAPTCFHLKISFTTHCINIPANLLCREGV